MDETQVTDWLTPDQLEDWNRARYLCTDTEGCGGGAGEYYGYYGVPDCGCDGLFHPYRDEDDSGSERWAEQYVGVCFGVVAGVPWAIDWTCDADGDWNFCPRCPLSEYDDAARERDLSEAIEAERGFEDWQERTLCGGPTRARIDSEARKARQECERIMKEAIEPYLRTDDTWLDGACDALDRAGLPWVYSDMTAAMLPDILRTIVLYDRAHPAADVE